MKKRWGKNIYRWDAHPITWKKLSRDFHLERTSKAFRNLKWSVTSLGVYLTSIIKIFAFPGFFIQKPTLCISFRKKNAELRFTLWKKKNRIIFFLDLGLLFRLEIDYSYANKDLYAVWNAKSIFFLPLLFLQSKQVKAGIKKASYLLCYQELFVSFETSFFSSILNK